MKKLPRSLALAMVLGFSGAAFAETSVDKATAEPLSNDNIGETIGVTCFGCHGYNGSSNGAAPSLAGHTGVAAALKDFKSGKRPGTIMNRIAKGYSDSDMDAVGKFFAGMK